MIAAVSCGQAMDDAFWQSLGYDKRPKSGALFQSFRKQWKVELERNILINLICSSIALKLKAQGLTKKTKRNKCIQFLWESFPSSTLGFSSDNEANETCRKLVKTYIRNEPSEWGVHLLKNFKVHSIPDTQLKAQLITGVSLFCSQSVNAYAFLKRELS